MSCNKYLTKYDSFFLNNIDFVAFFQGIKNNFFARVQTWYNVQDKL